MQLALCFLLLGAFLVPRGHGRYHHQERRQEGADEANELEEPETGESIKEDIVETFDCKRENETCWGLPKCCGYLVCARGFLGKGTCKKCVAQGEKCHADWQCCQGSQCDKKEINYFNGQCKPHRPAGAECFENSQCSGWCERHTFHIWGKCIDL